MSILVLPDVVVLARQYLAQVPELRALVGTRISTRSSETPVYPYLTLQRIGGSALVAEAVDVARIDLSAWGLDVEGGTTGQASASLVIRTARAALFALNRTGGYRGAGGTLLGVTEVGGPQWRPDTFRTPPTPRFIATFDIGARA